MKLEDILSDAKTFGDDLEMSLGEHKVKLGDLRGMTAKQQKTLSEKLEAAGRREQEAIDNSTRAATLLANLQEIEKKNKTETRPTDDADDFETNNWWTPVRKRMTAQEEQIKKAMESVQKLTDSFSKAATMFATDRWQSQYERVAPKLKKAKDYADWDMAKVRDYATKNNIIDEFGFPSVEKAVQQLTAVTDLEEARKAAREEGLKEGLQRARLAGQNRPSSATGGKKQAGKSAVEEHGLEGLGDDMADDPELMELLENARQAFDPQQLQ
jgi:hypothetical protein